MDAETIALLSAVGGVILVAFAQIRLVRKNGREQRDRDERIERERDIRETAMAVALAEKNLEIKHTLGDITSTLKDPVDGLKAVGSKLSSHLHNCERISSNLSGRVLQIEEDILDLKDPEG